MPLAAEAQLFPSLPFDSRQFRIEQLTETHLRLIDEVEINGDTFQFYADQVDIYVDAAEVDTGDVTFSLVANGNVVFVSAETRIAAEQVEFKTSDQSAVFYHANGSINMGDEIEACSERRSRTCFSTARKSNGWDRALTV
jgi:lipopolysaccharide export system protein LptA